MPSVKKPRSRRVINSTHWWKAYAIHASIETWPKREASQGPDRPAEDRTRRNMISPAKKRS